MGIKHKLLGVIGMAVVAMSASLAVAQPLAERVPASAELYFGWKGTKTLGATYEKSNFKGILDAGNVQQQVEAMMTKAIEEAAKEDPAKAEGAKLMQDFFSTCLKYPTAMYFAGLDHTDPDKPLPKIVLISQAGADAPALTERLAKSIAEKPNKDVAVVAKTVGDFVLLTIGPVGAEAETLLTGNPGGLTLANKKEFLDAVGQVHKDPAALLYANIDAFRDLIDDQVALKADNPQARQAWPVISSLIGLPSMKRAVWAGTFDSTLWNSQYFVKLDGPRLGLLGLMDAKPLSEESLKLVPKTATWAGVVRFDGARLLGDIRLEIVKLDPNAPQQLDNGLLMAGTMVGFDIENDLLNGLGDEWVYYGTPEAVGNALRSAVLVNKPKDIQAATRALEGLENTINGALMRRSTADGNPPEFKTQTLGDVTVHTIALGKVSPSWAIHDGLVYVAMGPQFIQDAVDYKTKKGPSILENEDFVALRKKLGANKEITSFSFTDLPKFSTEAFEVLSQMNERIAAESKGKTQPFVLPPLNKVKPFLTPMASVYWHDDAGLHMNELTPFPGANFVSGEQTFLHSMILQAPKPGGARPAGRPMRRPASRPATQPATLK